jgi:hypothetical protein
MIAEKLMTLLIWFFIGSICGAKAISDPIVRHDSEFYLKFDEALFATLLIPIFWPLYVAYRFFNK